MTISDKYENINNFKSYSILKEHGLNILKDTIEDFLSCDVSFLFDTYNEAKSKFNLDIHQNPNRGCYPIDDDTFFIYARIIKNNTLISGLGIILSGKSISQYSSFLNRMEGALTNKLSHLFFKWFKDCSIELSERLLVHAIWNYCARAYIDHQNFEYLISYFQKVKSTTFESNSFSTGLIITKSHSAYKKLDDNDRHGQIFPLLNKLKIKDSVRINRRFWYLADGKHTYFVSNKYLEIQHLFVLGTDYAELDYIDSNTLTLTLKGGDVLLRNEDEKQFSVIISEGLEFICHENSWRIRNYKLIKSLLNKYINDENFVNRLLFFILYCSKNSISTVIWIPFDLNQIPKLIKKETLNQLILEPISLLDTRFTNHIFRYLSSDGATIINLNGELINFGCIVDLSNLSITGVKGTGESAAQVLAENGLSFKVSQDGTIKMFLPKSVKPYII